MRVLFRIYLLFLFCFAYSLRAQDVHPWQYYVTGHVNLYAPISSNERMYPVLGYDKAYRPKLLVGGFGLGFVASKRLNERTNLRLQGSLSHIVYWDEPLDLRDPFNNPLGQWQTSSTDYSIALSGVLHHHFSSRFSVGLGAGFRTLLLHYYRLRTPNQYVTNNLQKGSNSMYRAVMPYIPLEVSYAFERMILSVRYEQSLLTKYNRNISGLNSGTYSLILMEVGFRL